MSKITVEQKWEAIKKRGKRKYIWINWVLAFGVGAPIISMCLDFFLGWMRNKSSEEIVRNFLFQIAIFIVIAYIAGRISWSSIENKMVIKKKDEETSKVNIDFCYFCGSKLDNENNICPSCSKEIER